MTKKKLDFLWRRPVQVTILKRLPEEENEHLIAQRLADGYLYEGGVFTFPAGFHESYIINNKDYNYDGKYSLEEQKELVLRDLNQVGFEPKDAEELIEGIETNEGLTRFLSFDASREWLKLHPEFERDALQKLNEARAEVQAESHLEPGRRTRRR